MTMIISTGPYFFCWRYSDTSWERGVLSVTSENLLNTFVLFIFLFVFFSLCLNFYNYFYICVQGGKKEREY